MGSIEIENRLISFAVSVHLFLSEEIKEASMRHFSDQLGRSSLSVTLNYAEARAAESGRDFRHKLKIVTKELRESHTCLRVLQRIKTSNQHQINDILMECDELVRMFTSAVKKLDEKSNPRY